MTAYQGSGRSESPGKSQKSMILAYFRAGGSLTQLEATKKFGCTRLASVVHILKQEGWEIVTEMRTARNGNQYAVYRLDESKAQPDEPGLFESLSDEAGQGQQQPYDTVDDSATALRHGNPVEVYGTEIRAHHVSNPGDRKQILDSFREYCSLVGGKKVEVTPDWARQLLKLNRDLPADDPSELKRNRSLHTRKNSLKLERFKKDFYEGKMLYTNVGVGFDEDGWLLDGQTRLTACLETGISFFADVSFDLPRDAFWAVDSHVSARTNADFAYMSGVSENTHLTVATVSVLYRKDHGLRHTQKLEPRQVLDALRTYADAIGPSMKVAQRVTVFRAPKSIIAAVHYLASQINKNVADKAFFDLATGATGDRADDPVAVARNRLMRAYSKDAQGNEFRGAGDRLVRVLLSRMFNYRLEGKHVAKYLLDGGDDWPQPSIRKRHNGASPS
jgi:hypothetical protein